MSRGTVEYQQIVRKGSFGFRGVGSVIAAAVLFAARYPHIVPFGGFAVRYTMNFAFHRATHLMGDEAFV